MQLFFDDNNKYIGFAGNVQVKDQEVFVDTRTGKGYDKIFELLGGMINYLASKYNVDSSNIEDNKQHVIMRILEGIPSYSPEKNTKLSTFLQMKVNNALINDIRDANRFKRSATTLKPQTFGYTCNCGYKSRSVAIDKETCCPKCGLPIDKSKRLWIKKNVICPDNYEDLHAISTPNKELSRVVNAADLQSVIAGESEQTKKIINCMYLGELSYKNIINKLGISRDDLNHSINRLRKNKELKELMRSNANVSIK